MCLSKMIASEREVRHCKWGKGGGAIRMGGASKERDKQEFNSEGML